MVCTLPKNTHNWKIKQKLIIKLIIAQGKYIYERSSTNGKRVQCNNGAKNHCVVMPDANKNKSISQIIGAAFGAAGQRCMALSVAVFVGKSKEWIPEIVEAAKQLKVNAGHVPGADLGPVISPQSKNRIIELVESGVKEGAKLPLDGRGITVPGYEKGNFVGPTVISEVKVCCAFFFILLFNCLLERVMLYLELKYHKLRIILSTI